MQSTDLNDGRRCWHQVIDAEMRVGHQQTQIPIFDLQYGRGVVDSQDFWSGTIDDRNDVNVIEGHQSDAGHGVQHSLPEIHLVAQTQTRMREMIERHRCADRVLQPRRRHETVQIDERNVEQFGQDQCALVEESVDDDQIVFVLVSRVHQLMENRIFVDGPAVIGHRFGHPEQKTQRTVSIVEIDVVLAVDFGHDGRVEHPQIGPIVFRRFETVPVSDAVTAIGQRHDQRLENVRVARRCDGGQDENVVPVAGLYGG